MHFALQYLGYTMPPQTDTGSVGRRSRPRSFLRRRRFRRPESDSPQRNAAFMAWNLLPTAHLLRQAGGITACGNQPSRWVAGCGFAPPKTDYR